MGGEEEEEERACSSGPAHLPSARKRCFSTESLGNLGGTGATTAGLTLDRVSSDQPPKDCRRHF